MNNMNKTAVLFGATIVTGLGSTIVVADENPFSLSELSSGYMNVAEADAMKDGDSKMKDGACGEGKCGGNKNASKGKEGACGEGKNKEGSCGEGKNKEGSCGDKKMSEGKAEEGKCGEGKCGGSK